MNSVEINKNSNEVVDNVVPQSGQKIYNTSNDFQVPVFDKKWEQIPDWANCIAKCITGLDINKQKQLDYEHAYDLWKALWGKKIDMIGLKNAGLNPLLAITNSLVGESAINRSHAIVQSASKDGFSNLVKMIGMLLMLAKFFV